MKPIDEGEPEDTQSGSSIKSVGTGDKWGLTDVDWLAYSSAVSHSTSQVKADEVELEVADDSL